MYKAVAFDLDHTLYDRAATFGALAPVFAAFFADYTAPQPDLGAILWEADVQTCNKTNWPGMYALLCDRGVFTRAPGFDAFYAFIFREFPPAIQPYPDTFPTLARCRALGYKTALITNGDVALQNRKIDAMGLRPHMDACMVSIESGANKPAPAPFLYMAAKLSIAPGEMLYVGDNPKNDVGGAWGAGVTPIWYDVLHDWDPSVAAPAHTIRALRELPALLKNTLL